jgi:pSer/pThr/pTyr-binding forkhead associated (FHA) protein
VNKVWLTIVNEGRTLDRHEFHDPREIIIGRHDECDVQVQNQGFSRQHCAITKVDGSYVLEDLGSSNGTFVRGEKVRKYALAHGDSFSVVGIKFTFEVEGGEDLPEGDSEGATFEMTMRVEARGTKKMTRTMGAQISRINAHLVMEEAEGTHTVILQQAIYQIGKEPRADLVLSGLLVPRMAALILRDLEEFWLLDVSPKGNVVTVNGSKARVHSLVDLDLVEVCGASFTFYEGLPRLQDAAAKNSRMRKSEED